MAPQRYLAVEIMGHHRTVEIDLAKGQCLRPVGNSASPNKRSGTITSTGTLLYAVGGAGVDRTLAARLQSGPTPQRIGLSATGARNHCIAPRVTSSRKTG